jgi:NAD(P)-dependent dehydrogenase (short-subunit alcohol dehydrogenase family)
MCRKEEMKDKVCLITGADGGIGREITKGLAQTGATIVMGCIDLPGAGPVCEMIKKETGNTNVEMMQIDLASLKSIRAFVKQFSSKYRGLNVLINNAGVYCAKREETEDGFEKTVGINYFGPFFLTNLLLPMLRQTPEARIINVSSNAYFQGKMNLNDLNLQKRYQGFKAYSASKLAIVLFTLELATRLKDTGVTVNAVHPGHVATDIWNMWPGTWYQALLFKVIRRFAKSPEEAAQASIFLASSDEVRGVTGKYFDNKATKEVSPLCNDLQLRKELWGVSEKLTGLAS